MIGSSLDRIAGYDSVKQLAQMIPHAVFDEIPGAGHLALFERPGEWRRLVTKFLS